LIRFSWTFISLSQQTHITFFVSKVCWTSLHLGHLITFTFIFDYEGRISPAQIKRLSWKKLSVSLNKVSMIDKEHLPVMHHLHTKSKMGRGEKRGD